MATLCQVHRSLLSPRALTINQKRYSIREEISKFVEPNKFKKHMLAATQPYFKRKFISPEDSCKLSPPVHELHPLDIIFSKELAEEINQTNSILFVQYNFTPYQSERKYKNTITKLGGRFHSFNNKIYREAFKILKLDHLNHLFVMRNALISGQAEVIPKCVRALSKMPQLLLIAGCIDRHVYNVDQLKLISSMEDLDRCRGSLVNLLNSPGLNLTAHLQSHSDNIRESSE
mgnify:CR=1 FL=1